MENLNLSEIFPLDYSQGLMIGRFWDPVQHGPSVLLIRDGLALDITKNAPTVSELLNRTDLRHFLKTVIGTPLENFSEIILNTDEDIRSPLKSYLLAPCDLQNIKANGVTFARSLLERVIEERAKGDPQKAAEVRELITTQVTSDLRNIKPGSKDAQRVKELLIAKGLWSQYLEVGIGPDVEVFTKSQPMSSRGLGENIGIHSRSEWNNPEPEMVLAVNHLGRIVGAALGNDVNLRDFEGRSALLLGRAKDNNASCSIGPFIRIVDDTFGLNDIRKAEISLRVFGLDGFSMDGRSSMSEISRDIVDLVQQVIGPHHQYPDGIMLFTGTMFAPTADRNGKNLGFTHHMGDIVEISSPQLGKLINRVQRSDKASRWEFGVGALMKNLAKRGLL